MLSVLLDAPTTHLDIQARERLEEALQHFSGTMCLVSHAIDFERRVATGIVAMTPPGVTRYPGGYASSKPGYRILARTPARTNRRAPGTRKTAQKG